MRKLLTLIQLIWYIKNWPLFLFDYMGDGGSSQRLFQYRLRDGLKVFVRPFTDDKWTIPEVLLKSDYWHNGFIMSEERPIIIDAGANIGCFTLNMMRRFPDARIFSIEPTDAADILQKNVDVNNAHGVTIVRKALAGHVGVVDFMIDSAHSVFSSHVTTAGNKGGRVVRVPTTTIDEIIVHYNLPCIDLLKCDIEGGEYDALLGLSSDVLKKIRNITMEYHLFEKGRTADDLIYFFSKNGFELLERGSVNPEIGLLKFRRIMQAV